MALRYVVITSVDRDDLRDGGAQHFADCITAIREKSPNIKIETLVPDVETRYVLQVVVKDVWWRCGQDIQRAVHTTTEIRHQRLNLNVRAFLANGSNAVSKVPARWIS